MSMLRRLSLALAVVAAVAVASPASAVPTLRTERTYFHCAGTNKVQNVETAVPSWNTTAPTQSVQAGAGCGRYNNLLDLGATPMDDETTWTGTFTGNLDTMTAELHNIHVSSYRALATMPLTVQLTINDEVYYTHDVAAPVNVPRTASSTGASDKLLISFAGIGLNLEEGDGAAVHTISLKVGEYNEIQSAWVWDTTEVPAGITFNPPTLTGKVLQATPPGF